MGVLPLPCPRGCGDLSPPLPYRRPPPANPFPLDEGRFGWGCPPLVIAHAGTHLLPNPHPPLPVTLPSSFLHPPSSFLHPHSSFLRKQEPTAGRLRGSPSSYSPIGDQSPKLPPCSAHASISLQTTGGAHCTLASPQTCFSACGNIKRVFSRASLRIMDCIDSFGMSCTTLMYSATTREKRLKAWKRAWKIELIEGLNPDWLDMYRYIQ